MEQELWIGLQLLGVLLAAIVPAVLVYRWVIARQRLAYAEGINSRLRFWGAASGLASALVALAVRMAFFGGYAAELTG